MSLAGLIILGSWHLARPAGCVVAMNVRVCGTADGAGTGAAGAMGPMGTVTRVPGLTHFMSLAGLIILGSRHLARPAGCVVAMNVRDVMTRQGLDRSRSWFLTQWFQS